MVRMYKPSVTRSTGPERRRGIVYSERNQYRQGQTDYRRSQAAPPARAMPMPTETKYFDTSLQQTVASNADWTGTEVPCTNYIQSDGTTVGSYTDSALIPSAIGAGYGQINGNKYYLKRLRIKGMLAPAVVPDSTDVIGVGSTRLTVVLDTQPQGAQAQGESVYTDMGNAVQNNFSFLAMAAGSGGRFQILKDKTFLHQPAAAGTDGASTLSTARTGNPFKFNLNWKKPLQVMLKANSATPTVASLSNVNIFILAHTTGSSGGPILYACARAYYVD